MGWNWPKRKKDEDKKKREEQEKKGEVAVKKESHKTPNYTWWERNGLFLGVAVVSGILLGISAYLTVQNEYVPSNKEVLFDNSSPYFNIVVTKERDILVPTAAFFNPKTSDIDVSIFFKNSTITYKSVKLVSLSANSSSLLKVDRATPTQSIPNVAQYAFQIKAGHPLSIANATEHYAIKVFYRPSANPAVPSEVKELSIPITWKLQFLDFGQISYFWIILLGVLASRVFSITFSEGNQLSFIRAGKPDLKELLWIPFSAIITLLIYSSFREQVALQPNIFLNLALAFGFGFGFDKVFEVWQKSPSKIQPVEPDRKEAATSTEAEKKAAAAIPPEADSKAEKKTKEEATSHNGKRYTDTDAAAT
jgi:hypothetical protein